jgi:hypothetical protein
VIQIKHTGSLHQICEAVLPGSQVPAVRLEAAFPKTPLIVLPSCLHRGDCHQCYQHQEQSVFGEVLASVLTIQASA